MASSHCWCWLFLPLLLLCTQQALAEPTDAERETARSLMDDGDRLRESNDLDGALQRYQAAHEIMRVPTTGIEVANTYVQLGKLVEARRAAIEVANLPVVPDEPSVFTTAREQARTLAASLAERIPAVLIQVTPPEAQATISVDQVQIPPAAAGLPYKTNPGAHTVTVTAPGYQTQENSFTLEEGRQATLSINLVPEAQPTPAPAAVAPAVAPAPAAPDEPAPEAPNEEQSLTSSYVALGIAGLGVVVGSVTGVMSLSKANSAKDHCEGNICSPEARDDIDSSKSLANVSNVAFGVGLVAGIYAAYTLLSQPEPNATTPLAANSEPTIRTSFVVSPEQVSAALWGAF